MDENRVDPAHVDVIDERKGADVGPDAERGHRIVRVVADEEESSAIAHGEREQRAAIGFDGGSRRDLPRRSIDREKPDATIVERSVEKPACRLDRERNLGPAGGLAVYYREPAARLVDAQNGDKGRAGMRHVREAPCRVDDDRARVQADTDSPRRL